MKTFKDAKGREWTVRVDGQTVCEYEDATGIDIFSSFAEKGIAGPVPGFRHFLRLLYLSSNAREQNLEFSDFASGISGVPMQDAWEALNEALSDFFPALKKLSEGLSELAQQFGLSGVLGSGETSLNAGQSQG